MSFRGLSSISFVFLGFLLCFFFSLYGQQKANDFTKRMGVIDGRLSVVSGKVFSQNRLSKAFSRRIKIEEWPSKYSPFGGRRFTTNDSKGLIKKRLDFPKISSQPANVSGLLPLIDERIKEGISVNKSPPASLVEFRDEYYASLNQRMDEWMEKVNNMSLRDVNRYQFRKGRPAEPGFPVQRAGSASQAGARLPSAGSRTMPSPPSKYWLGPRESPDSYSLPSKNAETKNDDRPTQPERKISYPAPRLGPKKIRVQINSLP